MNDGTKAIVNKLRRNVRPWRIVLQLADGEAEPVSLKGKRGVWERVGALLEERDWTRIDSWNQAGEALEPLRNPACADVDQADPDDGPPDAVKSRLAHEIDTVMRAVGKMAEHIRYGSKELIDQLIEAIGTLTTRNAELELYVSQAHELVHAAAVATTPAEAPQMTPKDLAMLKMIDGAGQKLLGLPPMQLPTMVAAAAAAKGGNNAPAAGETTGGV